MSDLQIHREHSLGLQRARKVAQKWVEHAQKKLGLECNLIGGETGDTVQFSRSGVRGEMVVTGERFEIQAKLSFLLKPFLSQIEAETSKQLDSALARESAKKV